MAGKLNQDKETTGWIIADKIRMEILNGVYKMGDKIRENEISQKYNVSRTPIREAFRSLQNEGILVYTPRCGVRVAEIEVSNVLQLWDVRAVLECLSASQAARFITAGEIQNLRDINHEIGKLDEFNALYTGDLDFEFHLVIAKASHNPYVLEHLEALFHKYRLAKYVLAFRSSRIPHSYKEHEDMIAALEKNESFLSEQYMRIHLHNSILAMESKLREYEAGHQGKSLKNRK